MCGIVGVLELDRSRAPSRHVLESMTAAIAHRGPDEHGIWVDGGVGLAARRLRVVDLVTGQQPLANEDGSVRLVANGEIYNAGELRDDLRGRGHLFTTRTDTEVILHAYEEEGPACLERLEGMFAVALWDGRRQRPPEAAGGRGRPRPPAPVGTPPPHLRRTLGDLPLRRPRLESRHGPGRRRVAAPRADVRPRLRRVDL